MRVTHISVVWASVVANGDLKFYSFEMSHLILLRTKRIYLEIWAIGNYLLWIIKYYISTYIPKYYNCLKETGESKLKAKTCFFKTHHGNLYSDYDEEKRRITQMFIRRSLNSGTKNFPLLKKSGFSSSFGLFHHMMTSKNHNKISRIKWN